MKPIKFTWHRLAVLTVFSAFVITGGVVIFMCISNGNRVYAGDNLSIVKGVPLFASENMYASRLKESGFYDLIFRHVSSTNVPCYIDYVFFTKKSRQSATPSGVQLQFISVNQCSKLESLMVTGKDGHLVDSDIYIGAELLQVMAVLSEAGVHCEHSSMPIEYCQNDENAGGISAFIHARQGTYLLYLRSLDGKSVDAILLKREDD